MSIDLSYLGETVLRIGIQIVLLIITYLLARQIGRKILSSLLHKSIKKQKVSSARIITLEKLLLNVYSYLLIFIFITMLFGIFDLPVSSLLASAGVVGLAVGFGAQGLVSDVVTGFFILLEKQIEVGEYITTDSIDGVVEEIGLRTTQLRGFDGTLHFIPNRHIEIISNHSRGTMRALVDIGVNYEEDIDQVMAVLQSVCKKFLTDERFVDGPNVVGVQELGQSSLTFRVIGQTISGEQWGAERDMRKAIVKSFEIHKFDYPYPKQMVNYTQKDQ